MKLLLFAIAFFALSSTTAQAVVANEKMNIVYVGVDNPLMVAASGYPCSSVVLTTDNGKLEKVGCGRFIYKPKEVKETKIKVWVQQNNKQKLVTQWHYRIKPLPTPVAFLSVYDNEGRIRPWQHDTVYKRFIMPTVAGLIVRMTAIDYDISFQITSYSITGLHNAIEIFKATNISSLINYQMAVPFEKLKTGDQLVFSDIKCVGPDSLKHTAAPLKFTIIE